MPSGLGKERNMRKKVEEKNRYISYVVLSFVGNTRAKMYVRQKA